MMDTRKTQVCPECRGSGKWKTYPGPAGGDCFIVCDRCKGTGSVPTQGQMVDDAEADRQAARDGYNPNR